MANQWAKEFYSERVIVIQQDVPAAVPAMVEKPCSKELPTGLTLPACKVALMQPYEQQQELLVHITLQDHECLHVLRVQKQIVVCILIHVHFLTRFMPSR